MCEPLDGLAVDRVEWVAVGNRWHHYIRVEIQPLRQGELLE